MGGKRRPVSGREKGETDIDHEYLAIQCKLGYKMPEYLNKWLSGINEWTINRDKTNGNRLGCVIWRTRNVCNLDSVVILCLKDFNKMLVQLGWNKNE